MVSESRRLESLSTDRASELLVSDEGTPHLCEPAVHLGWNGLRAFPSIRMELEYRQTFEIRSNGGHRRQRPTRCSSSWKVKVELVVMVEE